MKSKDYSYRHRSRTPSSESFSTSSHQDKLEKGKFKHGQGSSHHSMGNNAMSKALHQISKSFVRRINKVRLPHHFSQPTFTIYNGRSDSTHSCGFVRTPAQWKNHMKNPTEIPNKKPNENQLDLPSLLPPELLSLSRQLSPVYLVATAGFALLRYQIFYIGKFWV